MAKKTDAVLAELQKNLVKPQITYPPHARLSTGSTLLNLACSDDPLAAYLPGQYVYYVGDSGSGKTWLALGLFAEAARNPFYDNYQLIYDAPENGAGMDMVHYFGAKAAARITGPKPGAICSSNLEDFYYNFEDACNRGPCIYVLDSMDALNALQDKQKFEEQKKAHRKAEARAAGLLDEKEDDDEKKKKPKGSYGMAKAKTNSQNMRLAVERCTATGSILLIISQTRDNTDAGLFEEDQTRAGGHALTFYAHMEIWTGLAKEIKKEINGKMRQLGVVCRARVKKNRISGKKRIVDIPIYHSHGVDDTGACVQYLIEEKRWGYAGGRVQGKEDFPEMPNVYFDQAVQWLEANGLQTEVSTIAGEVWNVIEQQCAIKRAKRYE